MFYIKYVIMKFYIKDSSTNGFVECKYAAVIVIDDTHYIITIEKLIK